jgi:autotransporter-associated beta strand protein
MKKALLLLMTLVGLALSSASLHAALSYWDGNGTDPGAGPAPTGLWSTDPLFDNFWTYDSTGAGASNTWVNGDTAVFSAGTDATNAFDVFVDLTSPPSVGGLIFEEGQVTVAPASAGAAITMTNEFECPVVCNTNAAITADLSGTCGVYKTGPGQLTLGGATGPYSGTNTVVEGILGITSAAALGIYGAASPTIVSNGAVLEQTGALPNDWTTGSYLETIVLNGMGITNGGAFECRAVGGNKGTAGGTIILDSDARINSYAGNTWWNINVVTTNGVNNANLYIGGNGAAVRFYGGRACYLEGQVIYKDGATTMQFETPGYAKEVRWIEGSVTSRYGSGSLFLYSGGAPTPYYCGVRVSQLRNGNNGPNTTHGNQFILDAGAVLQFRPYNGYSQTINGMISGLGGISHYNDTGTLTLNAANTYSGNTVLRSGTTTLGASGSISNSAVIDVQTDTVNGQATFDVSAVTGGFVLQSAQTLKGTGIVNGNVTANGTLSPGASIGNLTFNNDLTVAGNLIIEVDVPSGFPANDTVTVSGTLCTNAGIGAMMVKTNGGAALLAGDSFTVFTQPLLNGQALTVFGGGLIWTNELASSGKITVTAALPVPATDLKVTALGLNSVTLGAKGGANQGYGVLASTDVSAPMSSWTFIGGATADGSGNISFTDTQATQQTKFYRLVQ